MDLRVAWENVMEKITFDKNNNSRLRTYCLSEKNITNRKLVFTNRKNNLPASIYRGLRTGRMGAGWERKILLSQQEKCHSWISNFRITVPPFNGGRSTCSSGPNRVLSVWNVRGRARIRSVNLGETRFWFNLTQEGTWSGSMFGVFKVFHRPENQMLPAKWVHMRSY